MTEEKSPVVAPAFGGADFSLSVIVPLVSTYPRSFIATYVQRFLQP